MARYLDPKNDLTFKRIFGEHPDLLMGFLNALMPLSPERLIKEVEYLPAEQVPDIPGKKNSIVDVKCKDKSGRVFIIEMQMLWTDDFMKRLVFNAGKAYVRQLDKSESYHLLQPVYSLAILNENFDHQTEQFYHHYSIVNKENTEEVIEGLEFVLVELHKFTSKKWSERKISALWLQFLRDVGESMSELPEELAKNEQICKAAELCEAGSFTPEQLAVYEAFWDVVRTEKTIREGSLAKGRAEGEAIGLKKGEVERDQLKAELKSSKENMVINSRKAGLPVETISSIIGLTSERIIEILKQHGLM